MSKSPEVNSQPFSPFSMQPPGFLLFFFSFLQPHDLYMSGALRWGYSVFSCVYECVCVCVCTLWDHKMFFLGPLARPIIHSIKTCHLSSRASVKGGQGEKLTGQRCRAEDRRGFVSPHICSHFRLFKACGTKTCLCFQRKVRIEFEAEHRTGFDLLFFSFYIVGCSAVDYVR